MKQRLLPLHFLASVLLLLLLVSLYIFSESRRFERELMAQTESKGIALAEAMETTAKHAIAGNSLLEDLIGQRLLDNARLIDQLLLLPIAAPDLLKEISAMNRLQKVELLDLEGRPWQPPARPGPPERAREMWARRGGPSEEARQQHQAMMTYMWGRSWSYRGGKETPPQPPPWTIKEKKFWEGSAFGVALGARSFPGIIAVHANADYILNFKKEIGVQSQIEELGRQPGIDHVALLDESFKIIAHTDAVRISQRDQDPFLEKVKTSSGALSRTFTRPDGKEIFEILKPIRLNGSTLGFLDIGLSLAPARDASRKSLNAILVLGATILVVGVLGMGAIFYNQHLHLREVRALEAEIAQQERLSALGNMAATVAHEIRNPLNAVSVGLQRLKSEFQPAQDGEQYAHFLALMQGEVRRLNGIVEQFLTLARPLSLKPEKVAIDDLLGELSLLAQADATPAKVEIQVAAPPDLPPANVDRNHLKQLLLNLMLNGIQAMPGGGALAVEAKAVGGNLVITVADNGPGIDPEILAHVFEPYFTTKTNGSGLGLAIARRIAEAHGGSLTAESQVERGSKFTASLPLAGPGN